jgi:beta-aspartyl-peptidase (threonine type)
LESKPKASKTEELLMKTLFPLYLSLWLGLAACAAPSAPPAPAESASPAESAAEAPTLGRWALAIHGGAGVERASLPAELEGPYQEALKAALTLGKSMLEDGASSLDTVEAVVRHMEDDPLFNAGKGAVFTSEGTNELDAAIMDGSTLNCGAVSGIKTVKNPITLARRVMDRSRHVFLMGEGAERFADEMGLERVPQEYFFVQRRYDSWQRAVEREKQEAADGDSAALLAMTDGEDRHGTVGAVALDQAGNLAAATSTGGLTNKRFGRVGDVPIIGAGTYANNATAAISCTGVGEQFIRNTVASSVSARVELAGESLEQAAREVIHGKLQPGDGGLIAVGKDGAIVHSFNSEGMFRGAADSGGRFDVAVWADGD